MYLYQFAMKKPPFGLTTDTEYFCELETHIEAINVLKLAIDSGEALIKVVGEVGTGKTMLCRLLLNQLIKDRKLAYIPYPNLSARELKFNLAKELNLRITSNCRDDQLSQRILTKLIQINQEFGPVILIIDEAQVLDEESLETLRLFTNLETEQQKLIQIILFGQPELDQLLKHRSLQQIKRRIVFSYHLKSLSQQQVYKYVLSRLKQSDTRMIRYSWFANAMVYYYSQGISRLIHVLCHKALLLSYGQSKQHLSAINIIRSANDTKSIGTILQDNIVATLTLLALSISGTAVAL